MSYLQRAISIDEALTNLRIDAYIPRQSWEDLEYRRFPYDGRGLARLHATDETCQA